MKTSYNWTNRETLLSYSEAKTPKPTRTAIFQNKLSRPRRIISFHEKDNWNDEHILKYRSHLKDIRELRSKWNISDAIRPLNASVEEKVKSDIHNFEASLSNVPCEKPRARSFVRPCSSKQTKLLQQIKQIYSFQQCTNRQNKMKQFLQSDDNYNNRSFRYYRNFANYLNQMK